MPKGVRPRVNEAREFLEIAKDFKDPKEIIREALSNSWDAGASDVTMKFDLVSITGTQKKKIFVEIIDDGEGMSDTPRTEGISSDIESLFNLGDSHKPHGAIGSKGHGTKIYYKSQGIYVDTSQGGRHIKAETEMPPWETLNNGQVPTYYYDGQHDETPNGTRIKVDGFQAKQKEFKSLDSLSKYIKWYTIMGGFGPYFGNAKTMTLNLKPIDHFSPVTIPFGFQFPDEHCDLSNGTEDVCKLFGPKSIKCGSTENGQEIKVDVVGALLGENLREIVPDTYTHMGLWLAKDYIRVERHNKILEEVFTGQYYYRSFLIFANCQSFDLTANRNNIRTDQEEYDLAIDGIREFCREIKDDEFVQEYFAYKKKEEQDRQSEKRKREQEQRVEKALAKRKDRFNKYKVRTNFPFSSVTAGPLKEPQNEAETALLLQAMISSQHPGIDFQIGDYNASLGVDLIVETNDKDMPTFRWVELVLSLDRLYKWPHPPEGYHIIVCYSLGDIKEESTFPDGTKGKLVPKESAGRYALFVGSETIDVYVLRELLQGSG